MIVGHKNYAGVSTAVSRACAEEVMSHLTDLDSVYVCHGEITEYYDGTTGVFVRNQYNHNQIIAVLDAAGNITELYQRRFDEDGYAEEKIDMLKTKSDVWAALDTRTEAVRRSFASNS